MRAIEFAVLKAWRVSSAGKFIESREMLSKPFKRLKFLAISVVVHESFLHVLNFEAFLFHQRAFKQ